MDNLSLGKVVSSRALEGPDLPYVVQRLFFAPAEIVSEGSRSAFRPPAKSDRLQIEFLIGISPES